MVYKDPVARKAYLEKYRADNKEKHKAYLEKYRADNKEKQKEYNDDYYGINKEQQNEHNAKYREDLKQHACDSITSGRIINKNKWDVWCNTIKRSAKTNKQPYSEDFSNVIMFEMMIRGCFYCGDTATTIDRVLSTIRLLIVLAVAKDATNQKVL